MISKNYSLTDERQIVVAAERTNRSVYLAIVGNSTAYIGGADVTDANGVPLKKHEAFHEVRIPSGQSLYGVMADGETETLRVLLPDLE